MPKLLLLDGHSLAYRAFYALPPDLSTRDGTVTNAVFGFTSMLVKVLADEAPDEIAVVFDPQGPTLRDAMDPAYKAGRRETPELFSAQLPLIREVLDAVCIPVVVVDGVEADDVIASLATRAAARATDVVVVTGDRDSYQLVQDPHITVLYNKRGVSDYARYDEAGIVERTGVTPTQYPEYAALRGDSSDNLPGVPGIGEKTAAKLVTTYGTVEAILEHVDELPPKQRQNLTEMAERVLLNRDMSVLHRDIDLGPVADDLRQGAFDRDAVRTLFDRLEFRTLFPRLMAAVGGAAAPEAPIADTPEVEVRVLGATAAAAAHLDGLRAAGAPYALEVRWVGTPGRSDVDGVALASGADVDVVADVVAYIPGGVLGEPEVAAALAALVGPDGPPLTGCRTKDWMRALSLDVRALDRDVAVMAYLVDPAEGRYRLEDLALRYCGIEVTSPDAEAGQLDFGGDRAVTDTARRAAALLPLAAALAEALEARELTDLYVRFERPLVRILAEMERAGIRIDRGVLDDLRGQLATECDRLVRRIHELAGREFNVNSTPQLRTVLFEDLGLTPVKKTKTGPSTDADSLQKLAAEHPMIPELLRYREVEKLRNTYADALPPLIEADGRVRATFKQTDTTTGRISSEHPNLQNIPVRTADGREFRRVFVADEGWGLLTADYSQIELRILADLADDPGLVDAFERGADIHTATAATVFGVAEADVDAGQRRFAKVVNYGLAYGMEAYGLAQRLDIPPAEAKVILDAYFDGFPRVKAFMQETIDDAKARGYTTTIFGRRRFIAELASDNFRVRQMGERMAQNAPVQGSAADIFKLAMIEVDAALAAAGLATRMLLTVHDELVFEVPLGERDTAEALVRSTMEGVCDLRVPLVVDLGFGPNWADAK
ncbi:MAG: DNA polymerase I [Actinobacteria bacterium]|nr:DNA polymerase I [Actinomycetota bacterium]